MMRVLLDTCVLSELQHPKGSLIVRNAVKEFAETDIFLSVVSLGEIAKGIALLGVSDRQRRLSSWLNGLELDYSSRILAIDAETARIWGELTAAAQKQGKQVSAGDGLIAATARRHGLHVMTRNISDFEPTGALLINPWNNES